MPTRPRTAEDDASFLGMGKVVAEARERRGLDEYEFAGAIGEDVWTVRRLESGKVNADWATLRTVARALDLPLDVLE